MLCMTRLGSDGEKNEEECSAGEESSWQRGLGNGEMHGRGGVWGGLLDSAIEARERNKKPPGFLPGG